MYQMDFTFYCPRGQYELALHQLREIAIQYGMGYELMAQEEFRNFQRFGARSTKAIVRFTHEDGDYLQQVVGSIRVR